MDDDDIFSHQSPYTAITSSSSTPVTETPKPSHSDSPDTAKISYTESPDLPKTLYFDSPDLGKISYSPDIPSSTSPDVFDGSRTDVTKSSTADGDSHGTDSPMLSSHPPSQTGIDIGQLDQYRKEGAIPKSKPNNSVKIDKTDVDSAVEIDSIKNIEIIDFDKEALGIIKSPDLIRVQLAESEDLSDLDGSDTPLARDDSEPTIIDQSSPQHDGEQPDIFSTDI